MNDSRNAKARRPVPSWLINMLGFGLLIGLVLAAFSYQMRGINESLKKNALERSQMVAAIIEENLAHATLALTTMDQMVTAFLRDKAEFIAYLDGIDPLQPEELTALARETGLLGITLVHQDATHISGPSAWLPEPFSCSESTGSIRYIQSKILLGLDFSQESDTLSCILTGFDGTAIVDLRTKSSLPALLSSLSALPGIHSVDLIKKSSSQDNTSVELITDHGQAFARSKFSTRLGDLVVSIDAHQFLQRRDRLRQQFFFFAILLLIVGLSFSWLLYRFQQKNLHQVRTFEQLLAHEHEAAALGRTTATIAHEIRNPLNALNMGLQRLRMESNNLDNEQKELIAAMGEAVKRTSGIISELQRFTRPLQPALDNHDFDKLLRQLVTLYTPQIEEQQIALNINSPGPLTVQGDQDLLNELLENLVKNAVEAQPNGGYIHINLSTDKTSVQLTLKNGGLQLTAEKAGRIGEPYYTSKTRGTGLGLALSKRIAKAHGGGLEIIPDCEKQVLTVILNLPIKQA
jgi:signal transduction histidine kinase